MTNTATLRDKSGAPVPFLGSDVEALIGDAVATTRITQRYRNAEARPIEVIYTFPLPDRAVLLDFEIKLGDRLLAGRIVELVAAKRRYEEAIDSGDSAVLVQSLGQGLFSASLGNLMPGEEASITFRYATENLWEDGHLAWRLPTVIAPRYGDSRLSPEQEPVWGRTTDNRATVRIVVEGAAAAATIGSPTHEIGVAYEPGRARVNLLRGDIAMDRDIVLNLEHHSVVSTAQMAQDQDGVLVWASFIPSSEAWASDRPNALDIVIDCSGSMQGTSISVARQALERIVARLGPRDRFNLIRFGNEVETLFLQRVAAEPGNLARAEAALRSLQADMGGTEIAAALRRVWHSGEPAGDLILITDGHVHGGDALIAEARAAGVRIFAIGVGSQVQETLVRGLAEATGGAAELVSPGESMAEAIARQFRRIKSGAMGSVHLDWGTTPITTVPVPRRLFAGDTVHVAARFPTRPTGHVALSAHRADGRPIEARIDLGAATWLEGEAAATLVRIEAARRLDGIAQNWRSSEPGPEREAMGKAGLAIALQHGLMSPWTGMIVVRENDAKAGDAPPTRVVAQMAPAGMDMMATARGGRLTLLASLSPAPASSAPRGSMPKVASGWLGNSPATDPPRADGTPARGIARQRFVARLRNHLRKRGIPRRIDELVDLRLEAGLETLLRRLALSYQEADVVRTFVRLLTEGNASVPDVPEPLVEALRGGL